MKQVTGKTNPSVTIKGMSIQLKRSGHSFSVDTLGSVDALPASESVRFVVLTHKTLLIPREEFDAALAADYLRLAGVACLATETPVWSDPNEPVVAVMAADTTCVETLRGRYGDRAQFTTPLLEASNDDMPSVWLYRVDELLYIKVYDRTLRFAEVVSAPTEADVIYYIEQLGKEFALSTFVAHITGEESKKTMKMIRSYFKQIQCE
ncbi:MAG: DUF3822 family protein [Alistipes sp.]